MIGTVYPKTTLRAILVLAAISVFSRMYFIINENKKYRNAVLLLSDRKYNSIVDSTDAVEMPYLFAMFILLLSGMPIIR